MLKRSSRLLVLYFIATFILGVSFSSHGQASGSNQSTDFLIPILSLLLEEEQASTLIFDQPSNSIPFTVPAGINFLQVEAYGGQGGRGRVSFINGGAFSPEGGLGGRSEDIIPVMPGQELFIVVGGQGGDATGSFGGGGGGGYSAILSVDHSFPLILAGGGGGAAAGNDPSVPGVGGGASGGDATDFDFGNGAGPNNSLLQGQGGANGQGGAGGLGTPSNAGGDGVVFDFGGAFQFGAGGRGGGNGGNGGAGGLGFGGEGGLAGGGGGGGYGGGGGGALDAGGLGGGNNDSSGAGGGGGGFASFNSETNSGFPDGTTESGVNAGDGKVIINLFSQRPPQTIVKVFDTPSDAFEYNLPAGGNISEINIVALGARGGTGGDFVLGGIGGREEATVSLLPNQSRRLMIVVGGRGGDGFNGGGGGGGGKSSVAFDYDAPIVTAGGGGGGAGGRFDALTAPNGNVPSSQFNDGNQGGAGIRAGENGLALASQASGPPPATGGVGGMGGAVSNANGSDAVGGFAVFTDQNGNSVGGAGGIGGGGSGGRGVLMRIPFGSLLVNAGGGGGGGGGGVARGGGGQGGTIVGSFSGTGGGGGSSRSAPGGLSFPEGNTQSDDGMVILTYTIN